MNVPQIREPIVLIVYFGGPVSSSDGKHTENPRLCQTNLAFHTGLSYYDRNQIVLVGFAKKLFCLSAETTSRSQQ